MSSCESEGPGIRCQEMAPPPLLPGTGRLGWDRNGRHSIKKIQFSDFAVLCILIHNICFFGLGQLANNITGRHFSPDRRAFLLPWKARSWASIDTGNCLGSRANSRVESTPGSGSSSSLEAGGVCCGRQDTEYQDRAPLLLPSPRNGPCDVGSFPELWPCFPRVRGLSAPRPRKTGFHTGAGCEGFIYSDTKLWQWNISRGTTGIFT